MLGPKPVTLSTLADSLQRLGISAGDTLLVHSSLRSFGGWVCGGATTVVSALLRVIGTEGTLAVPAQSPECQDPTRWSHCEVPAEWWPTIRHQMPPFDVALTPASAMGVIAERVRTWPGALRSDHPLTSFAAIGPDAQRLLRDHELSSLLGEHSPLAKLEAAGARILLLGVGYDRCTAFHLAEYRLPKPPRRVASCLIRVDGVPNWTDFETIELDASDFQEIGKELEASTELVRTGKVAGATARLMPLAETVGFAHQWLLEHRIFSASRPQAQLRATASDLPGRS
jgi:aminoglycoside 3-N-acetyltransferase